MANSLNIDLEGKTVILTDGSKFLCEGGFGCRTYTMGSKIFGKFVEGGAKATISGHEIERLAE